MFPYFILILMVYLLNFRWNKGISHKQRFWLILIFLFLFAAFRSNDYDYKEYIYRGQDIFTLHDVFYNTTHMEPGYCLIALIVNRLHLPLQMKIAAMNFIGLLFLSIIIKKLSPRWDLSLLIYFQIYFPFDMQTARSAVAIEISTLCAYLLLKKNYCKFIIALVCACLFHRSALICLLLIPLAFVNINKFIGLGILLFEIFFVRTVGIDRSILGILKIINLDTIYDRYQGYIGSSYAYSFKLWDFRLWLLLLIFLTAKWIFTDPTKVERFMTNCVFAAVFLMILFSEHTIFAIRLSAFFSVYCIILIPLILYRVIQPYKEKTTSCSEAIWKHSLSLGGSQLAIQFLLLSVYALLAVAYAMQKLPYSVFFLH